MRQGVEGERQFWGGPSFLRIWVGLGMGSLLLLLVWNWTDPLPPAWDEAQHLLQAQAFGAHLGRFRQEELWWRQFLHLSQRYPPLAYWLGIPFSALHPFSREDGQLLNLLLLGILAWATQRLGQRVYRVPEVGWLAAGLLLLYPGITALAHVYMLELPLILAVALAFWALYAYAEQPSWRGAVGVGAGVAAVLLTKWTGILFLLLPLAGIMGQALRRLGEGKGWQKGIPVAQLGLGMAVTALLCWPWYGANWLFVLSNGWGYASTGHYYVTCAAGSLCWWTTYLRLLPQQMTPFLCGLPLLSLWGSLSRGEAALWATWGSGYLLYTLVEIKDVRFTLPLLPLLAVLSAGGIQKAARWAIRRWPGAIWGSLILGSLALGSFGQPLTPGAASLWTGIRMAWGGEQPAAALTGWVGSLVQPGLTTTLGVIPNTELISPETLTYLAALRRWPVSFRAAGQTPWPELELSLLDGFVDAEGEMGIIGPYGPAKEQIRQRLHQSGDWQQELVKVPGVGRLQVYRPSQPTVTVRDWPNGRGGVELAEIAPLAEVGIPAWRLRWQGSAQELAQTLVWARLEDPLHSRAQGGRIGSERAWVLGRNRLRATSSDTWTVEEILTLPLVDVEGSQLDEPSRAGRPLSGVLHLEWQLPQGSRYSHSQPWTGSVSALGSPEEGSPLLGDVLLPLRKAAAAASVGDLENLSLYLNAWTTLQHETFLTDPDRDLVRRLLEGEWRQAAAQGQLERQLQSDYELGWMSVALLQPQAAQLHFQRIVERDPGNRWARAYLALVRILFTHDFEGIQGLRQELSHGVGPFCQKADRDWDLNWICTIL